MQACLRIFDIIIRFGVIYMGSSMISDSGQTVKEKINAMMGSFSKGQKRLAEYILENYDTAAFLTAAKLGKKAGVSESTAVRFAVLLGYEGYPELQEAMAAFVQRRLGSVERIEAAAGDIEQSKVLSYVLGADIEKIRLTMETIEPDAFELAVDMLNAAEHVYVVGVRSCAPLAEFLGFYLRMVHDNVRMITTNSASEMFEQMLSVSERDVVVGISFPRYSMRTLKCMEYANNKSAEVIAITDSRNSPMSLYSSCNLLARSDMTSIVDSLVAPMSVINALIVALCMKNKERVAGQLEELNRVWNDYQVYNNDEINQLDEDLFASLRRIET